MPTITSWNPFAWIWFKEPSERDELLAKRKVIARKIQELEGELAQALEARDYNNHKLAFFKGADNARA